MKKSNRRKEKKISDIENDYRVKLITLRNGFRSEVYDSAYKRLKEIKGTDEYYSSLESRLEKALERISSPADSVIFISKEDSARLDLRGMKAEPKEYELGGFEIEADGGKRYIDCRILTSLNDNINGFINKLGIVI